ncbi:hypothetical protein OIU84_001745 [Salix udensis]|uniref:Uncharacterized protein n=1 Tax=Salix udensis TaxID=889485 RepID=A0AAD6P6D5_9ROSI|nr:hypothetical protein OIU84_001745 [Salix udensis]
MASPQASAAPPSVSQTVPSPPPLPPPPEAAVVSKLEEKKPSEKGVPVLNAKLEEQPDISHFESVPLFFFFFFFLAEKELTLNFNSS